MTYKIAWVQPNFQQGPKEFNAYYLPYSAGVVWSYSLADPWIQERFEVTGWIWRRDPINELALKLSTNHLVAFSTYVWNHRYNYEVARRVKEINPAVLTIFGGPEPAITDPELFVKEPFIDIVICFEGEITFRNLMLAYPTGKYDHIPGLLINKNGEVLNTGDAFTVQTNTVSSADAILSVLQIT